MRLSLSRLPTHIVPQLPFCIGITQSQLHTDSRSILVWKSPFVESIQIVVPVSLCRRIVYLCRYPLTARHPGERRIYDTLCRNLYWPHMASGVQRTVAQCVSYARGGSTYRHKRRLQLFPAFGPLEFVAMDFLGPMPKRGQSSRPIVVMDGPLFETNESHFHVKNITNAHRGCISRQFGCSIRYSLVCAGGQWSAICKQVLSSVKRRP